MSKKFSLRDIWALLKETVKESKEHNVTKLSGSLAYYTVFSMAPLLVVIISLAGLLLGKEAATGKIYSVLQGFLGNDTAAQLQEIITKASISNTTSIAAVISIITLLIGATTVFAEIQDSINGLWGLKAKPKRGWLKMLQNRFLSFSVIVSLSFILLISLGITGAIEGLSERLKRIFPDTAVVLFYILNLVLTLVISMVIFAVIFKVLPDAKIKWRDVLSGAFMTAILFIAGKFGISLYISQTKVGSTYGAAGSLVILLVWVYYSSIILYLGASFTKVYAVKYGSEIRPNSYAVTTKQVEVETGGKSVQEAAQVPLQEAAQQPRKSQNT
ncbi:MAG: YihY/virulence factor BrkB family protein [Ferruginibacter sp.]